MIQPHLMLSQATIPPHPKPNQEAMASLFERMISYRDKTADMSRMGPWLRHQLSATLFPTLAHLPFEARTYTRNYIAREVSASAHRDSPRDSYVGDAQYEALIMRWDKQVTTSIHGHPKFSFYHVISGLFEIDTFEVSDNHKLRYTSTQRLQASEATWFLGQSERYDNWIHRVTCLKPGFTFHIYSEDAQKGKVYS